MAECGVCLVKIKSNEASTECSGICKKTFHGKCVDMKAGHCKLIEECNSLKWFCDSCTEVVGFVNNMYSAFDDFKKEMKSEIAALREVFINKTIHESCEANTKTYSSVAKEVVVIKPKSKQESTKTKESVKECLNPAELKVGISEIRNIQEGGIIIKCDSKKEAETLKAAVSEKLGEKYNINSPKPKYPCIKISDIDVELDNEELILNLKNQNDYLNNKGVELKVVTFKKMKKNYMAIIQCDPKTYFKILEEGKIFLNWSRCRVFEYVNVFRCFSCGGFNHSANKCDGKGDRCLKCSKKGHKKENCTSESSKCINCLDVNLKSKSDLDVSHSCFDICCPILQKKIENEKRKVCYKPINK